MVFAKDSPIGKEKVFLLHLAWKEILGFCIKGGEALQFFLQQLIISIFQGIYTVVFPKRPMKFRKKGLHGTV